MRPTAALRHDGDRPSTRPLAAFALPDARTEHDGSGTPDEEEATMTPSKPTKPGLVYLCQRPGCGATHFEAHEDPSTALRRAVENGQLHVMHACPGGGGAVGLCRLGGTATT